MRKFVLLLLGLTPFLAFSQLQPHDIVKKLQFKVKTSNDILSGTSNDVWFDIGPKAWKYTKGFSKGETVTIAFDPNNIDENVSLVKENIPLYVEDITQLRIEKKGISAPFKKEIGGITNAPDDVSGMIINQLLGPIDLVSDYQKKVETAKNLLNQKQDLIQVQQELIDKQTKKIIDEDKIILNSTSQITKISTDIKFLKNRIIDLNNDLIANPEKYKPQLIRRVENIMGVSFKWGVPHPAIIDRIVHIDSKPSAALTYLTNLTKQENNLQADLQAAGIQRSAALQAKTLAESLRFATLIQKKQSDLEYVSSRIALENASNNLTQLNDFIKNNLPHLPFDEIPRINQWKPEEITIIVNGIELKSFHIDKRLKQGHPSWICYVHNISNEDKFVNGLRVNKPDSSTSDDEEISRVTTPLFKDQNVSGWEPGPVNNAEVVGVLVNKPSHGGDGYVSFDLKLEKVTVNGLVYNLDGKHNINHLRYIRIEHIVRQSNNKNDDRFEHWKIGKKLKVKGHVKRDTDRITFFEIHTESKHDIQAFNGVWYN
ncbi:hypothetical protein [Mucilaginibacter flavus]|uniref:hypothetical protein n=1 Tax=Mucilaginibacter flavus TaxID=931504 RepID=UPI0025B28AC4|nr:hypothetical protein [Mucilaginibacter flavus]MDN3585018.1 hypothetical protein [Mucilaginibacter flavus]